MKTFTSIKIDYTDVSLVRTMVSMHLAYMSFKLMRNFEVIKTITNNTPEEAVQLLIQRDWNGPPGSAYMVLCQYIHHYVEGEDKAYKVMLAENKAGARVVEITVEQLNRPRSTTYGRYRGDESYWQSLIERSGTILDEPVKYTYPELTKSDKPICVIAPAVSDVEFKGIRDKDYNPRYNMLLDKEHLETSDNQSDMVDVVNRLVNGINWLDRAFTDRPYVHSYQVEGNHSTHIKLVLFPDRSKLTVVRRLVDWDDSKPEQVWVGVNPYNNTTREYLEKLGVEYHEKSVCFINV